MRLYFKKLERRALERRRGAVCEAARKRGLAGAGRADEKDDAVEGQHAPVNFTAKREVEGGLREKAGFQPLIKDDRVPKCAKSGIRQSAYPLDTFGHISVVCLWGVHLFVPVVVSGRSVPFRMELDMIVLPYLTAACQRSTNLYRQIERISVQLVGITKECGMSFATKLKELRIRDGRSLQQVADAVETSKTHVWDMEQGNSANPGRELLVKLAGYFRTSVSELVGEDPNSASEPSDLVAMYRDLKSLSPADRKTIETIMRGFKDAKKDS